MLSRIALIRLAPSFVAVACALAQEAPAISLQPKGGVFAPGTAVVLSSGASGTPAPSLQWLRDGNALPGATNPILRLSSIQPNSSGTYVLVASNILGVAASSNAVVVVPSAPLITSTSPGQQVGPGTTANLFVNALGVRSLSYQWFLDGARVPGATDATLSITNAQAIDAGIYTVRISNFYGNVESRHMTLKVSPAPPADLVPVVGYLHGEPDPVVGLPGYSYVFNPVITGGKPMQFQWYHEDAAIPGATNGSFSLPFITAAEAGHYWILATNAYGTTHGPVINLGLNPFIFPPANDDFANRAVLSGMEASGLSSTQAASREAGDPVLGGVGRRSVWWTWTAPQDGALTVTAIGSTPTLGVFTGSDLASLVPVAMATDNVQYVQTRVIRVAAGTSYQFDVDNFNGAGDGSTLKLSFAADPPPGTLPGFTTLPQGGTVPAGSPFTLSAVATGIPPLTYQWYLGDNPIDGARTNIYVIANAQQARAGDYTLVVGSPAGPVRSAPATLLVTPVAPSFAATPAVVAVTEGNRLLVSLKIQGTAPDLYQWIKDGVPVPHADGPAFARVSAAPGDAGVYQLGVSGSAGSATSAPVQVKVVGTDRIYIWSLLAGSPAASGLADGTGREARFVSPRGLRMDHDGSLLVVDVGNDRIRRVTPDGVVTTLLDSTGAPLVLRFATDLVVDATGTIYVTCPGWYNGLVRIHPDGTWEGRQMSGFQISLSLSGSLLLADFNRVVRLDPDGSQATLLDNDGTLNTTLELPTGDIVLAEFNRLRLLHPDGTVSMLSGKPGGVTYLDGSLEDALFGLPTALARDAAGDLFVADLYGPVRRITPDGRVMSINERHYTDDDGIVHLTGGSGIAIGEGGVIYVGDPYNQSIRKGVPMAIVRTEPTLGVAMNPAGPRISWPQAAAGYGLEVADSVSPSAEWVPVVDGVAAKGDRFELGAVAATDSRYYRLRLPTAP